MKRLKPYERNRIVLAHLDRLTNGWVCRYGAWNAAKLLAALARQIRDSQRKELCTSQSH